MADQGQTDLPYGHYGNAVYDPEERTWSFQRAIYEERRVLTPLEDLTSAPPGTRDLPLQPDAKTTDHDHPLFPSIRRQKQIDALIRRQPEVQPTAGLLGDLLRVSEAVEAATANHDPARGRLMSFGRIFHETLRRPVHAVAFATGPTGSDVRIELVQMQRQGWDDSRDVWLEVPTPTGIGTTWKGPGVPVQQVHFAQPVEGGEALLAVRLITSSVIFKPVMRKHGSQRLDANAILEPSINQTGGVPHADIAFNPSYGRQFAVIDQRGDWSVWESTSQMSSKVRRIHTSVSRNTAGHDLEDGWARIIWVASPSIVLAATRTGATLFGTSTEPAEGTKISLGVLAGSGRVLDIAAIPSHLDWCCVLTSTHLCYVHVAKGKDDTIESRIEARVAHFRGEADISLRLQVVGDGSDSLALIQSVTSPLVAAYRTTIDEREILTLQDPTMLRLRSDSDDLSKIVDWTMSSVEIREKTSQRSHSTTISRCQVADIRFLGLTALRQDTASVQELYLSHTAADIDLPKELPTWASKLEKSSSKVVDSFVVDDDEAMPVATLTRTPQPRHRMKSERHLDRTGDEWTVSYERCVCVLGAASAHSKRIEQYLETTGAMLEWDHNGPVQPMRTLHECEDAEVIVRDLDAATAGLSNLLSSPDQPSNEPDGVGDELPKLVVRQLDMPTLSLDDPIPNVATLDSLYDSIVSVWITALPPKASRSVRLAKEQLARRMAASVSLASHVIRHEEPTLQSPVEATKDNQSQTQSQQGLLSAAGPSFYGSSQTLPGASQSQSLLPTPSPTGTPSISTQHSVLVNSTMAVLGHLCPITKMPPALLSRPVKKVFTHWPLDSNIDSYDWLSTSRTIAQQTEEEEADSQLTEKQRERLQRKAEKHLRRQRREAEASAARAVMSSQVAEVVVAPTRAPSGYGAGASQQAVGGAQGSSQVLGVGAASQVLPGRFGGKMVVRKKRKQGF
ncbi:hypothetical protein LTR95_000045 [Oleoguttula sp. CCFEE 5521]